MTTYIFVLLFIIIVLLIVLLMRRPTVDVSGLREDNARLRERLAERLRELRKNEIELKKLVKECKFKIVYFINTCYYNQENI